MKFIEKLIADKSDFNAKTFVGFLAFGIMSIFAFVDIATGYLGKDLVINENIYHGFLYIVLGAFGISGVEAIAGNKNLKKDEKVEEEELG